MCIIGSDSPQLSPTQIGSGFDALATHEVALGLSRTGGYGCSARGVAFEELLADMPWSTSRCSPPRARGSALRPTRCSRPASTSTTPKICAPCARIWPARPRRRHRQPARCSLSSACDSVLSSWKGADPLARYAQQFRAGTVLFEEGDPGENMYVVQSGRVRLTRRLRGEPQLLAVLPAGEFFGEMAIVNNRPRSATAEVIEDAQLLVLDAHMFEALVRGNAEIALRLIKRLAARLDQANSQVKVIVRGANHRAIRN